MITITDTASENRLRRPPVIHLIGDSTMADKCTRYGNPERGWGQFLGKCFRPEVTVLNHARDGRSSKSFIWEGLWDKVCTRFHPDDWLVIQFGHNDQMLDRPLLCTDPGTTYRQFLTYFVREADAREVHPIFATSICRCRFTDDGRLENTLGDYPAAMSQIAHDLDVPLIDLNEQIGLLLQALGPEKSKSLFLHFARSELTFCPKGITNDTCLSLKGAKTIANIFAQNLRNYPLELARWLNPR